LAALAQMQSEGQSIAGIQQSEGDKKGNRDNKTMRHDWITHH
jgi:hypothetical protein